MTDRAWGGPAFSARVTQLNQMSRRRLIALIEWYWRRNTQRVVYNRHPLTRWTKDELITETLREEGYE